MRRNTMFAIAALDAVLLAATLLLAGCQTPPPPIPA